MPEKAATLRTYKRGERPRPTASQRGYNARWRRLRGKKLRADPLCAHCMQDDRHVAATEVDHVIPHRGDASLMWDYTNLQSLCKSCHSRKTRQETFGRG